MPELPEVEIARENLERWLGGRRVTEARIIDRLILRGQSPRRVEKVLRGATIREFSRRGKYLIWDLGKRGQIVSHLGMTGKFLLRTGREPDPPSVRVGLQLARGRRLLFVDPRRLGSFRLADEKVKKALSLLGVEPLSSSFTPPLLEELLDGARLPIKSFLMGQHRVAGLGNIHVAEALFRAGIHPARQAGTVKAREVVRLHGAIRETLIETLRRERSDEIHYLHETDAENEFLIYGREGEPCPSCRARVKRLVQAGRSSYFCPRCQPRRH